MAAKLDWQKFESALQTACIHAFADHLGPRLDDSPLYVIALFGVTREVDYVLSLPLLAASTERTGAPPEKYSFWDERWNPEDWRYICELDASTQARLEDALNNEASRGSVEHWLKTEERYIEVLWRVATALRQFASETFTVCADFVSYWHDEQGGVDAACKTIPAVISERIFAYDLDLQRSLDQLRSLSPEERATFLVSRLRKSDGITWEDAERELITIGAPALRSLIPAIRDTDVGWAAAKIIATIGTHSPEAIRALRARVGENYWFASALGYLGDHDWLVANAPMSEVVVALTVPLASWLLVPLDYHRLEAFLEVSDETGRTLVEKTLSPGSGYLAIGRDDVPEALRGLSSRHPVIRWHAAAVLYDRALGAAAGKRILPALERALLDEHPNVRFLALDSLLLWKSAAKPYLSAMKALRNDPDEKVRNFAASSLPDDE